MKDEVEKLISKFGLDASLWGALPDKYPKPKDPTAALLSILAKAQVEAVRAELKNFMPMTRKHYCDGPYCYVYALERLAVLTKEDGETK